MAVSRRSPDGDVVALRLPRRPVQTSFAWLILIGWAVFAVGPMIWLLIGITKNQTDLNVTPWYTFGSFTDLGVNMATLLDWQDGVFLRWAGNSVLQTALEVIITVVTCIPAGYALATLEFPGRRPVLYTSLAMMILPASSLVLPLFLMMTRIGLFGSIWAVILPLSVFPFGMYVAYLYFSTAVSREFYDAARLDGCSEFGVFFRVGLPLGTPVIGLVAFFAFLRNWNEYLLPRILLRDPDATLPVGLQIMASFIGSLSGQASEGTGTTIAAPVLLLATGLAAAPVVIGVLLAHRVVVRGAGAMSGGLRG